MMKFRIILGVLFVISGIIVIAINEAPETSTIQTTACVQRDSSPCIRFPTVTGDTLNGETVSLPKYFSGDYNLVIVSFNREQQEAVVEWLPIIDNLRLQYEGLQYYSLGALPDLPAGIRLLVSGGMSIAVDSSIRDIAILAYLDDQKAFADALDLSDLDEAQIMLLNPDGEVVWSGSGKFGAPQIKQVQEQVGLLELEEKLSLRPE